jgi:hypothetical protein
MQFDNRTLLVPGAGIGRGIVTRFALAGGRVMANDIATGTFQATRSLLEREARQPLGHLSRRSPQEPNGSTGCGDESPTQCR